MKIWNPQQLVVTLAAELYALGCLDKEVAASGCTLKFKYNFTPDATPLVKRSFGVCAIQFAADDSDADTIRLLGHPSKRRLVSRVSTIAAHLERCLSPRRCGLGDDGLPHEAKFRHHIMASRTSR
eukprot:SAG31_NODE_136_length_23089_cov_8.825924_5_plen_125_part_00